MVFKWSNQVRRMMAVDMMLTINYFFFFYKYTHSKLPRVSKNYCVKVNICQGKGVKEKGVKDIANYCEFSKIKYIFIAIL